MLKGGYDPFQPQPLLAGGVGYGGMIEQSLTVAVEIAQRPCLNTIGKDAKQEMAGQVRGRSSSEYGSPPGAKLSKIEIAQTRDLDFEWLSI